MAERTPSPRSEPQAGSKGTRRVKDAVEMKLEMLDGSEVTVNDVDVSLRDRTNGYVYVCNFSAG